MQTTLFKIVFNDGRMFKVFCANKKQIDRFRFSVSEIEGAYDNWDIDRILSTK